MINKTELIQLNARMLNKKDLHNYIRINLRLYLSCLSCLFALTLLLSPNNLAAEGTPQIQPTEEDNVAPIYINAFSDVGGIRTNFAGWANQDTFSRLWINIIDPQNECIFIGLGDWADVDGQGKIRYRIFAPDGTIVKDQTMDAPNIADYTQAISGPNDFNGSGYDEGIHFISSADLINAGSQVGNYWIEMTEIDDDDNPIGGEEDDDGFRIGLFDFTVASCNNGIPQAGIDGRLWSYRWEFRTNENGFEGAFYVCAADLSTPDPNDGYITKIDFKDAEFIPRFFNVIFNDTGIGTTGIPFIDRKSVEGDEAQGVPEFKAFLNDPDVAICSTTSFGNPTNPLTLEQCGPTNFCWTVSVDKFGGEFEILLDLNGTPGFQENSADILLTKKVVAGEENTNICLDWDGFDGTGNQFIGSTINPQLVYPKYLEGIFHFPVFDAEVSNNGFMIEYVRPIPPGNNPILIKWDDSEITDNNGDPGGACAKTQLEGCDPTEDSCSRCWTEYNYGDRATLNTFWNILTQPLDYVLLVEDYYECAIAGPDVICLDNETVTFSADLTTIGNPVFRKYTWEGPNGVIATGNSLPIQNIGPFGKADIGIYRLTVEFGLACKTMCTIELTDPVPPPAPEVDDASRDICAGEPSLISFPPVAGMTYNFYDADPKTDPDAELLGSGNSFDPMTEINTTETIYITCDDGICEGPSVPVFLDNLCETDLTAAKDDGSEFYIPATSSVYHCIIRNLGQYTVSGARITDNMPPGTTITGWNAQFFEGALGTELGSGDIDEFAILPGGSRIEYLVTVSIPSGHSGTITNVITVTPPDDVLDVDLSNNSASDTNNCMSVAVCLLDPNPDPIEACDIPAPFTEPTDVFYIESCASSVTMDFEDIGDTDVCSDNTGASFTRTYTLLLDGQPFETCSQSFIVVDLTDPVINCPPDIEVECTGSTNSEVTGVATATDNCGSVLVRESDEIIADCGNTLTILRTWTATDACGNDVSCVQTITVVDSTLPSLSCPPDVVVECPDDTSSASTGVATADDSCGGVTISESDQVVSDCGGTATITRTWTATDACGNSTSCTQTITVVDTNAPDLNCPADVELACGEDTSIFNTGEATGSSSCGGITITHSDEVEPMCGLTETITRTWTATDACGNSTSCVQIITVVDNDPPEITCPPVFVQTLCSLEELDIDFSDGLDILTLDDFLDSGGVIIEDCGIESITYEDEIDNVNPRVVDFTRTFTVIDACGNAATCQQIFSVTLESSPEIECPEFMDLDIIATANSCSTSLFWEAPDIMNSCNDIDVNGFTDEFSIENWTHNGIGSYDDSQVPIRIFLEGANGDQGGPIENADLCVTVLAPGIINFNWIATMTNGFDSNAGDFENDNPQFVVNGVAFDLNKENSGNNEFGIEHIPVLPGDQFCFRVTSDNLDYWTNLELYNFQFTDAFMEQVSGPIPDSFEGAGDGELVEPGTYMVEYQMMNAIGAISTCSFEINIGVIDEFPPVIHCPGDMTITLDPGECDLLEFFSVWATDNCTDDVTINQIDGTGFGSGVPIPEGTKTTLTYQAVDEAGLTSECSFVVEVKEAFGGNIACQHINLSLDENCEGFITADFFLVGEFGCRDNYDIDIVDEYGNPVENPITDEYLGQTLTVTVSRDEFNQSCWGTVLVEDKYPPSIVCEDLTLSCTEMMEYEGPEVEENCSFTEILILEETGGPTGCDDDFITRITRKYQAVDASGNTSNICEQNISIKRFDINDVEYPGHLVPAEGTALSCLEEVPRDENGNPHPDVTGVPTLDGVDLYNLQNQNLCNVIVYYEDFVWPDSSCMLKVLRTWIVREWYCEESLVDFGQQEIIIADEDPPMIYCPEDMYISTRTSEWDCIALVTLPAPEVSDRCSEPVTYDVEYPDGYIHNAVGGEVIELPVGEHIVTYTAFDQCGNSTSCEMKVNVVDETPPVAVCKLYTVVSLTNDEVAAVHASSFDNGSHDDCGIEKIEAKRTNFETCGNFENLRYNEYVEFCCNDIGKQVVVHVLVTDVSGQTNECEVIVTVEDKLTPDIFPPPNITVSCEYDFDTSNYNEFGVIAQGQENVQTIFIDDPFVQFDGPALDGYTEDNCTSPVSIQVVDEEFSQCGFGLVVRKFTVGEGTDTEKSVYQNITIKNLEPFDGFDITQLSWPPDYEVDNEVCEAPELDPENLSAPFNGPIIIEDECDLVAYNYNDEVLEFGPDLAACFKILRTWTVIDWCQSDGENNFRTWTHVQVLKVTNSNPPEINCEIGDPVICSYDPDCGDMYYELIATATDDCTPVDQLDWEFEVDLYFDWEIDRTGFSNNASGIFPVGSHIVRWYVEDKCGNRSSVCEYEFEVRNCKGPIAYCLYGIATDLNAMDVDADGEMDTEMVMITPEHVDAGSEHPCGYDISLSFSQDGTINELIFTCEDIGRNEVELWVTDENGNQSVCIATVDIQDNNGVDICPAVPLANITGLVYTEDDERINNVEVKLDGSELANQMTDMDGQYAFPFMQTGGDYEVIPNREDNPMNGVSTLDLVWIQNHILGYQTLDSPYKIIAADVNNSQSITASDMLEIRKLILGVSDEFDKVDSWRFVTEEYEFVEQLNPWVEAFPEQYTIPELSTDMNIDFIGIKMGDVNGNANPIQLDEIEIQGLNRSRPLTFDLNLKEISKSLVAIQFIARDFEAISGFQFTLKYPVHQLRFESTESGTLDFSSNNVGSRYSQNGLLTVSWNVNTGIDIPDGEILYEIIFDRSTQYVDRDLFDINAQITFAEAYQYNEIVAVNARFIDLEDEISSIQDHKLQLLQNTPNPWSESTQIDFYLPEEMEAQINIYEVTGKRIHSINGIYPKGLNQVEITRQELGAAGLLYYELKTKDQSMVQKMLLLK